MSEDYLGDIGPDSRADGPDETMTALLVLSTELGQARAALAALDTRLEALGERANHLSNRVETLTVLSAEVRGLSASVAKLLDKPATEEAPSLLVDLAHIPAEHRADALAELVDWVRDVLFVGWPHAQTLLECCWPYHPEIVNALLWLRAAYHAAYGEGQDKSPHCAADFYFWLRDVLKWADERTLSCSNAHAGRPHLVVPERRDDTPALAQALRREVLAELYDALQLSNDPKASTDDVTAARERVRYLSTHHDISRQEYDEYAHLRQSPTSSY
ncbi:hypothetical protein ACFFMN_27985 [Planobispora siamensis]|uniref:Uncharacterized protein n=1 Tax=Planobispora siamensis TaxID=936338 RepID=A0A8J3SYL2_9ACTN|nr:hypothetical protein [Planobispora siamensis]GIH97858.1 hypothetical protein Psi01_84880 [Planobispora siamensis]